MKTVSAILGLLTVGALSVPVVSLGEQAGEQRVVNPQAAGPVFPPSEKCTSFTRCENIIGEVIRIEESYWVKQPNGTETHMRVTKDTHMKELPRVGDSVAAQITSTGDVNAIMKVQELPERKELQVPSKSQSDLR
ncbi:MAG TPA: hypothetical protein VJ692_02700 [Nitrospiraceae bacterium]|nr:hypothetical protein [Nitrospiraceae bacterium]